MLLLCIFDIGTIHVEETFVYFTFFDLMLVEQLVSYIGCDN